MISSAVEEITPTKAKSLVASSDNPRGHERASTIAAYVRMMEKGRWRVGPAILIDEEGKLLDGFQRLRGVIQLNKPMKFVVTRGLNRAECVGVIDGGIRRPAEAVLRGTGRGGEHAKWCKEVLSSTLRLPHNYGTFTILNADYVPLFDLYKELLDFGMEAFGTSKGGNVINPIISAFIRAYNIRRECREDLLSAAVRFRSQSWDGARDEPFRLLSLQLANMNRSARESGDLYLRAANAIDLFLRGQRVTCLKRAAKDPFPISLPW